MHVGVSEALPQEPAEWSRIRRVFFVVYRAGIDNVGVTPHIDIDAGGGSFSVVLEATGGEAGACWLVLAMLSGC